MKKTVCALLAFVLLLNLTPRAFAASSFSDVPENHWAHQYIEQMVSEGILTGYTDGTFKPDAPMKRAEFAVALAKIANLPLTDDDSLFSDVNDHWGKNYIVAVSPYIDGISASTFEPNALITREVTVAALMKAKAYAISPYSMEVVELADFDQISPTLQPYVAYALKHNMVSGYSDNTFRPQGNLSRAEACALLYKAFRYEVNTVASNLTDFRSMVMDNDNNLYYIDGDTIFSTKTDLTLDIVADFSGSRDSSYLAYDPYHDIVYLITDTGWNPAIYDITDFNSPILTVNKEICPALNGGECGQVAYSSYIKPQIGVLPDGTLLIPFETRNSTWMINPEKKTVIEAKRIYFLSYQNYAKIIDNKIMQFESNSTTSTIYSEVGFGTGGSTEVKLGIEAPEEMRNSLCSKYDSVYFYQNSIGVRTFTIDGAVHTIIPQDYITIKDYLPLGSTNIWSAAVGDKDHFAFYDNSLNCIRLIQNAQ